MALSRKTLALAIPDLTGSGLIRITNPGRGWPSLAEVQIKAGKVSIALYVGPVGRSHRARDAVERRFQNPGSNRPIVPVKGALPVLLGVWREEGSAVFVGMSAMRRLGRATRHSLFMPLNTLRVARQDGWAEHES